MRCTSCGRDYRISEYLDEIDEQTWEKISGRSCDRA
ncbi:MAG: hypothetical protein ACK415_12220 [Thermodesulfovibrionales bacterium]